MVDGNFEVEVIQDKGGGTKLFSRDILVQIIEPRMEEMFTLIEKWLKAPDHDGVRISSAVITGGASSLMGMDELAKSVLKMPVRIGTPGSIEGVVDTISRPSHSTAVNLALFEAGIDGVSQGIKRSGGSLFVQHATLAIKRILERIA
jgi:cell division protein FtsA